MSSKLKKFVGVENPEELLGHYFEADIRKLEAFLAIFCREAVMLQLDQMHLSLEAMLHLKKNLVQPGQVQRIMNCLFRLSAREALEQNPRHVQAETVTTKCRDLADAIENHGLAKGPRMRPRLLEVFEGIQNQEWIKPSDN